MPNLNRLTWVLAIRGIAALLFGVLAMNLPGLMLKTFIFLFAFFSIVDGCAMLIGAMSTQHHNDWLLMLIAGILSMAIGVVTLMYPGDMTIVLVIFIGARALVVGSLEIAFAFGLRQKAAGWLLPLVSGIISILFGLVLFAAPTPGALALVWVIGAFAIGIAILQLIMAAEVRHWGKQHPQGF